MKQLTILLAILISSSTFAEQKTLCFGLASPFDTYSAGKGWNLTEVVSSDSNGFSQLVCDHSTYGNYLHDNLSNIYFKVPSAKECLEVVKSMSKNQKSAFYFTVDTETKTVLSAKREDGACPSSPN